MCRHYLIFIFLFIFSNISYARFEKSIAICKNPSPEEHITLLELAKNVGMAYTDNSCEKLYSKLSKLNYVRLNYSGNVTDISPVSELINLEGISIADSKITDITAISKLTNLQKLYLNNNKIKSIKPLANLKQLQYLDITDNPITDFSIVSQLTNIRVLFAAYINTSNTPLSLFPLKTLTKLELLQMGFNHIDDLSPISELVSLEVIGLSNNDITDISPLSHLTKLKELVIIANKITDIRPLAHLDKLEKLDLSTNDLRSIQAIAHLKSPKLFLSLAHCNLKDLSPLHTLSSLKNNQLMLSALNNPLLLCSPRDADELASGKTCPPGAENSWYWNTITKLANFFGFND